MSGIDIGVIFLFSFLVFVCGMSFSKSGKNMKSFFSAGGALPWWMSGLSLFMSFFSSGTFVTWGALAYSNGWVAITIQWTMAISGILIGFFIAPRWQKTHALTAAEFIKNRFGYKVQRTYTYIFLAIASFSTGAFLYPVAKILEVSTGIPITASIIVLGILILAYTAVGGLWAVIVTDILQFVVLTAAVLIVVPLAFGEIGGVSQFIAKAPEGFFNLVNEEFSWSFIVVFGLYNLFFIAGNWPYIQRYTSVATPNDAKKVGWLFGGLYVICPVIWMIPPMIYRVLNPDLAGLADEGAYLLMCKQVLPLGMLGLMLGAMIFATASSVNTSLNLSAGVLANDVYGYFRPKASDKELVKVGRIATILLGTITIVIALLVPYMGGVVTFVFAMAAITGGALFLPPIWALFSPYQTGKSLLTVTLITLAVNMLFKFVLPYISDISLDRKNETFLGICLPIVLLSIAEIYVRLKHKRTGVVAWKTSQVGQEPINQQNDVDVEQGPELVANSADNNLGVRVIGWGIASIGILMGALMLVAEHSQVYVAGMGFIILCIGGFILSKNPKIANSECK
ncbi:sodium:solute symporter family protein [Paraglaciecola aquimarina]|uniref:Sodium:solute symporter family protein n=1 Tax=Paraglaciecola aquimarina TaxID=1235557 RepID=A0ABU3SZG9_9ALTE|nr:sodium:solute symporter family protein [Paraglaciecola aquimarina]MDU0355386.1 sodium:solute symporter family protein [Paraglaciecola aquimarina]